MIEDIKRDLLEIYKNKPHRMRHIEGVLQTAIEFGKKFKLDLHKLELAALLHDITKYYPLNEQKEIIKANYSNADYILNNYNDKILHSYSAAFVAKEKYGITDNDVLGAIMHHTIGKANMNMYEKIIFLSDYIEPGRVYESCVKARELAKDNIDLAVYAAIDDSIIFYEKEKVNIPRESYQARAYYKKLLEELIWLKYN